MSSFTESEFDKNNFECPVCFDEFSASTVEKFPVVICRLGHNICNTCADPVHVQGTCPICRKITLPNGGIINRLAIDLIGRYVSKSDPPHSLPIDDTINSSTAVEDVSVAVTPETKNEKAEDLESDRDMLAEDLFLPGLTRCFYGSFDESTPGPVLIQTSWMCKLVLKSVSTLDEFNVWIQENEFTVLNEGDEIFMFSQPSDIGTGPIHLIGHITWTDATVNVDFSCDTLNSAFELVAGTYDPTHRLLSLRGIGVRQEAPIIAATGYLLHVSKDGRYVRGWCRGGDPNEQNEFEFTPNIISLATKINVEEIENF